MKGHEPEEIGGIGLAGPEHLHLVRPTSLPGRASAFEGLRDIEGDPNPWIAASLALH